jgi:predicted nucleic acid-binding protein
MVVVDTSAWVEWLIGSAMARRIALDTSIALAAAEATRTHKLATADAIVFATAQAPGASILTCDGHFKGLPAVVLIDKRRS